MARSLCTLDGCDEPAKGRGLCLNHYHQERRRPGWTPRTTNLAWLEDVLRAPRGDACIDWPFGRDSKGYGTLRVGDKGTRAHRFACEFTHGPAPADRYEAAHSCGRKMCVNPSHLRWASSAENNADKIAHGTHPYQLHSKLTPADVRAIRAAAAVGTWGIMTQLARQYGVRLAVVSQIVRRVSWAWVTDEPAVITEAAA